MINRVMDQQTFATLLEKYLSEDLSREETARLLDSLQDDAMRRQWEEAVTALLENKAVHGLSDPGRMQAIREAILAREAGVPVPARTPFLKKLWPYAAAAAVIALAVTGMLYFSRPAAPGHLPADTKAALAGMRPGGNKAVLTLADGSQITLDSVGNGAIASQGNVQVIKLNSGQLAYKAGKGENGAALRYNTLSTPRGGQFRIVLPDGSKVWLNAASSLRFPTAFSGKAREVQLTGEAYFEIAKDPAMPFEVKVNDMAVQVLGTHFNVMAYPDEHSIRTTLLEGAVRVQHAGEHIRLQPGEQAQLSSAGKMTVNKSVDIEGVMAWKNGYFNFDREPLEGVIRQIGRWYDVEITYEGNIPYREFGGKIARGSSITEVLKILELSGVHYRVEDRKIVITP
ncbi:FecR family protein [Chitinophaga japonensis]|uniref:FecR family protein n=2 Tax=Chitinophaga japonensis TaxID=104662 RepID=A0A562SIJ4_CHIJA|nr:FecR family protein [Chitinophaga japonensis]